MDVFARVIRVVYVILISFSIVITYHVMVVEKNYDILTNPDGPDTSDYELPEG